MPSSRSRVVAAAMLDVPLMARAQTAAPFTITITSAGAPTSGVQVFFIPETVQPPS